MITKIINTFCLALLSIGSMAQPNAEFDSKTVDFGKIMEGTISKHSFKYKNTGNQPLVIEHVSVTCGCTAPTWSKQALLPGDTASVYIEFDSRNKMGQVAKGVNLMTNCPEPLIGLIILAHIVPDSNFKAMVDSVTYKPMTIINFKSYFELKISMKLLAKKGFKGTTADAEVLIKKIIKDSDLLLAQSTWTTLEIDRISINAMDKNLQPALIALIQKELLNKKRLKYWIKKVKT